MKELAIKRHLDEETRKQSIVILGEVYSLHISDHDEVIITDYSDYTKIYRIESLEFFNLCEMASMRR